MVHGGGKLFTAHAQAQGLTAVCQRTARDGPRNARCRGDGLGRIAQQTAAGAISAAGSPQWASALSDSGCLLAEPMMHDEVIGGLGFVGYLTGANLVYRVILEGRRCAGGIVPRPRRRRELYNINPTTWPPPAPNSFTPTV